MGMREWMNDNNSTVTIGAAVVLVVAVVIMLATFGGGEDANEAPTVGRYFLDLTTNKPFVAPPDAVPPIDTPGGKKDAGVRAVYLTCGGCGDRFLGWLERFTPEAKRLYLDTVAQNKTRKTPLPAEMVVRQGLPNGFQVRGPDGGEWVAQSSARGQEVVNSARDRCGDKRLKPCDPSD